jgi:hypothetical protein
MFLPLALVLALAAVWSLYWFIAFTKARDALQTQRAALAADGTTLACAHEGWGGYPFRFEWTCNHFSLTGGKQGATAVKAGKVLALAQAYNPFHILALVDGPTEITGEGLNLPPLIHDRALLSLTYSPSGSWDFASDIPNLKAAGLGQAGSVKLFARTLGEKLEAAANLANLEMTSPAAPPLAISAASVTANLDKQIAEAEFPLDAAAETGKPLTISNFTIAAGEATLSGQGAFTLDADHRLNGTVHTATNSIDKMLAVLQPQLHLTDQETAAASAMIKLLGGGAVGTGQKADVLAKNGELYWGPFKLGDVPPLR